MTGPTHVVLAAAVTVVVGQRVGFIPGIWGWGALIVGSLLPDIDEPRSTASNPAGVFSKLVPRWVRDFLNAPFQAISRSLRSVFGHRGATHYLLWPLLMGGWYYYYDGSPLLAWFAWGYLLHLLADLVTRIGIPAFGPLYRKNVSLLPKRLRIKTGSAVEDLINTACWVYLIYAAYVYL